MSRKTEEAYRDLLRRWLAYFEWAQSPEADLKDRNRKDVTLQLCIETEAAIRPAGD
jgi:hypothetical protein